MTISISNQIINSIIVAGVMDVDHHEWLTDATFNALHNAPVAENVIVVDGVKINTNATNYNKIVVNIEKVVAIAKSHVWDEEDALRVCAARRILRSIADAPYGPDWEDIAPQEWALDHKNIVTARKVMDDMCRYTGHGDMTTEYCWQYGCGGYDPDNKGYWDFWNKIEEYPLLSEYRKAYRQAREAYNWIDDQLHVIRDSGRYDNGLRGITSVAVLSEKEVAVEVEKAVDYSLKHGRLQWGFNYIKAVAGKEVLRAEMARRVSAWQAEAAEHLEYEMQVKLCDHAQSYLEWFDDCLK